MTLYQNAVSSFSQLKKQFKKYSNYIHSTLLPTPILPQYASDPRELHELGGFIAATVTLLRTERT